MARGLKRVSRDHLTFTRRRIGRGFRFYDAKGEPLTDERALARISALGIPPAWREVCIAAQASAHVQAIGIDEAGRSQYIYHADWEQRRAEKKRERLAALTRSLPRIRRAIARDLAAEAGSQELALAIAVALIDITGMRLGRERYLKTSGTRGAGTLFRRDVSVDGATICVRFKAKGGKAAEYCFRDSRLAGAIERISALPGRRLLVYRGADGKVRPIATESVNAYLRKVSGAAISAKDFRTLHASALAGEALSRIEQAHSLTARKRQMAAVVREVAQYLRNTPAICRKSYIAPCLLRLFEEGRLRQMWVEDPEAPQALRRRERRLSAVISVA